MLFDAYINLCFHFFFLVPKYPISMRSNVIDPIYAEITNKNKFDNGRKENNNKDGGGFCLSEKVFTLINEKKSKSIKK